MVKCRYSYDKRQSPKMIPLLHRAEVGSVVYIVLKFLADQLRSEVKEDFIHGKGRSDALGRAGSLWDLYSGHEDERRLFINSPIHVVAELEGKIVGGSWFHYFHKGKGHIIVEEGMTRRGIGSNVLSLHERFGSGKYEFGWSNSSETYDSNMRFFSKHGYSLEIGNNYTLAIKSL